jgi:hypothetical protein
MQEYNEFMIAKEKITLETLARMIQNGFSELRTEFKSDLKHEIGELRKEMYEGFARVDARFEQIDSRFNTVEIILKNHETRITDVEKDTKNLKLKIRTQ